MPRSMFYLTCVSLLSCFILLPVSMLDFGVFSLYVNPLASFFTILYHTTAIVVSQRKRTVGQPSYFDTVVRCAYILGAVWLAAFILTVMVLVAYKGDYTPESLREHGLQVSVHTQRLQCFLTAFEFTIVNAIAFSGHMLARDKGDPQTWRPYVNEDEKMMQIQVVTVQSPPYTGFSMAD